METSGSFTLLKTISPGYRTCGLTALPLLWWPCTAISLGDLQRRQQARTLCRTISPSTTAFPQWVKNQRNLYWHATQIATACHGHQSTQRCFLQCMISMETEIILFWGTWTWMRCQIHSQRAQIALGAAGAQLEQWKHSPAQLSRENSWLVPSIPDNTAKDQCICLSSVPMTAVLPAESGPTSCDFMEEFFQLLSTTASEWNTSIGTSLVGLQSNRKGRKMMEKGNVWKQTRKLLYITHCHHQRYLPSSKIGHVS